MATKVVFEGKEEPAEEVNFEVGKEGWSTYDLSDGTSIKLKNVVSRIFRLLERQKPDGKPIYVLEGISVVTMVPANSVIEVGTKGK